MAQRPQFDSRQKFVIARELKFAGRLFKEGQEFPWRRIGCSVRRLGQLYNARKLNMLDAQSPVTEEKLLAMEPEVKPVEKATKVVVDASKIDAPAADEVEASTEVADKPKKDKKPKLTDEQKAKKNARRKAARKAAKLAEAKGE